MRILIQKFGGTSVSTPERRQRVVEKVQKAVHDGFSPVVVVSAMGRKGEPYATDSLLTLITERFKSNNSLASDLLMSCGEIISTVVISDELDAIGLNPIPLTGGQAGIVTNENFNDANVVELKPDNIVKYLKDGKIPVVAGFQGISEDGFVTTIGRGGSDVTAALLGAALQAELVEIYTDVDGIMTADPNIVSDARLISEINYDQVFELACQGAKVIHPRAVAVAKKSNIKLVVKNTMSDAPGTIISSKSAKLKKRLTGITHAGNRIQISIALENNKSSPNYSTLIDKLNQSTIRIDLINVSTEEKVFTIDSKDKNKFNRLMKKLDLNYSYIENLSKIAVIGNGIKEFAEAILSNENIQVLHTVDSDSTICCLVNQENMEKAINLLHRKLCFV